MPKINFDHENTNTLQRLAGVLTLVIFATVIGLLVSWAVFKFNIPRMTAIFALSMYLAAELYTEFWNKYLPWSGAQ